MTSTIDLNTFNALKEATGDDFIKELIDTFLEDTPNLIRQINEARAKNEAETIRRAAHSMKSNAATFGAMELSALAREIEGMARDNNIEIGNRLEVIQEAFTRAASQLKALK